MRSPFSLPLIVVFVGLLLMLQILVQIGALSIAFDKLGLSHNSAMLLLLVSLFGSAINLPLFTIAAEAAAPDSLPPPLRGLLRLRQREFTGKTLIAVNVGGGMVPTAFSLYLFLHNPLTLWEVASAVLLVSTLCYLVSRPVPGLGIGMPVFVAPLAAASVALLIDAQYSAPLAYICGTLGVLIGADLLRLGDIRKMGTPVAAIGGAGTFDGIFITGLVAVLLA
jgi:uncharacterized membrane protein